MSLLLGWLGAMAAIITGLFDQSAAPRTPEVLSAVINQHITAGIALLVAVTLALYWPLRNKRLWDAGTTRWGYLALLLLIVGLVAVEGWLGGSWSMNWA